MLWQYLLYLAAVSSIAFSERAQYSSMICPSSILRLLSTVSKAFHSYRREKGPVHRNCKIKFCAVKGLSHGNLALAMV